MGYYRFFVDHRRFLSFGILLTLFSSFGQTFLISLFLPAMLEEFPLNKGEFGSVYSLATLASAGCLPFLGRLIDRVPLRTYSLMISIGMMISCLVMAGAQHVAMLFVGIVGLRLMGQGLLSHTAATAMARSFEALRGKAVSVASLGFPLGEAIFPVAVAYLIGVVGWRWSWGLLAFVTGVVLMPFILYLLRHPAGPAENEAFLAIDAEDNPGESNAGWRRADVLRDARFYRLLPASLIFPFLMTGLFLYQIPLAESKGWAPAWMASGFFGFAVARLVFSLVAGPWIDRWGALQLFPVYLLPVGIGLVGLHWGTHPWMAPLYLFLAGISQGLGGSIKSALWAELYGIKELGAIRSLVTTLGILSSAVSPVVFGWLLEAGIGFDRILPAAIVMVGMTALLSLRVSGLADCRRGEGTGTAVSLNIPKQPRKAG